MQVEVARKAECQSLHKAVVEDLDGLCLPRALIQHCYREVGNTAGRHSPLKPGASPTRPEPTDVADGKAEVQEAGQGLHSVGEVGLLVHKDIQPCNISKVTKI